MKQLLLLFVGYEIVIADSALRASLAIYWRLKENFLETFKSQQEKNRNVIHRLRSVRIGRNCALGLSTARGRRPRAVLKTSGTVSPNTDLPAGE